MPSPTAASSRKQSNASASPAGASSTGSEPNHALNALVFSESLSMSDDDFCARASKIKRGMSASEWANLTRSLSVDWLNHLVWAEDDKAAFWLLSNQCSAPADCSRAVYLLALRCADLGSQAVKNLAPFLVSKADLSQRFWTPEGHCHPSMRREETALEALWFSLCLADPSSNKPRWALADWIAAEDPSQPLARIVWKEGGPNRLPRLAARVEAEWLRQAANLPKTDDSAGSSSISRSIPRRL